MKCRFSWGRHRQAEQIIARHDESNFFLMIQVLFGEIETELSLSWERIWQYQK